MTLDRRPELTSLQLSKSLHPAAAGRPRHVEAPATGPDAGLLSVLWGEEVCRARLQSVGQGWLSGPSLPWRLPVTIASVEGGDLVLVGLVAAGAGGAGPCGTAELEVGGASAERRWTVRARGLLQSALPEEPPRVGHEERSRSGDALLSETEGLAVLVFTISSLRGFATARRPVPTRSRSARSHPPAEEGG